MIKLPLWCLNCHNQVLELTCPRADKWTFTLSGISLPVCSWLTFKFLSLSLYIYFPLEKNVWALLHLLGEQFLHFQWVTSEACLKPAPAPGDRLEGWFSVVWTEIFLSVTVCMVSCISSIIQHWESLGILHTYMGIWLSWYLSAAGDWTRCH